MPVFANMTQRWKQGVSSKNQSVLVSLFAFVAFLFLSVGARTSSLNASDDAVTTFRRPSREEADRKSAGCITCHIATDEPTMHPSKVVQLGCTDCHGGDSTAAIVSGTAPNSPEYSAVKEKAHVQPRDPAFKNRSSIPERAYTKWLKEPAEYIKFVNPGDLRVAPETCGAAGCHPSEV